MGINPAVVGTMKTIFDYDDHQSYLNSVLPTQGPERGIRSKLAAHLSCQSGFITQALNGKSAFSLEHGHKIAEFLRLNESETDQLLLLIQKDRAGTKTLRSHLEKKVKAAQAKRKEISERIPDRKALSDSDKLKYYSSWIYSAVHMALMVPELQSHQALESHLSLPQEQIKDVVEFLVSNGMAKKEGSRLIGIPTRIHLPHDSPLIQQHHANWRLKSLETLGRSQLHQDFRYSLVMSASPEAVAKMKSILLKSIEEMEPILKSAADKNVYSLNIDLFGVGRESPSPQVHRHLVQGGHA